MIEAGYCAGWGTLNHVKCLCALQGSIEHDPLPSHAYGTYSHAWSTTGNSQLAIVRFTRVMTFFNTLLQSQQITHLNLCLRRLWDAWSSCAALTCQTNGARPHLPPPTPSTPQFTAVCFGLRGCNLAYSSLLGCGA